MISLGRLEFDFFKWNTNPSACKSSWQFSVKERMSIAHRLGEETAGSAINTCHGKQQDIRKTRLHSEIRH